MAQDKKKVAELKPAVAKHLADIEAGRKALEELEKSASPAIEALVNAGDQLGPYKIGNEIVRFRKRTDGRYLVAPVGEAL